MEILGIGMPELIFVIIIAIIVLGPKDMQKAGKTIGKWLNRFIHSDVWKVLQKTTMELRNIPRNLMRDVNMEGELLVDDIQNSIDQKKKNITRSALNSSKPIDNNENKISPSELAKKEDESEHLKDA
ncbi:MAG: twin-arginine translocase TatA/TatE family subunit [Anaerolineales bacterium]|nr:twin-arginine translocase TatA/TatE family subunit [Anaerolineales bacterium]